MSKKTGDPKVHHPEIEGHDGHEDDLIVAPKGKSKTRFLLTFLLVIFLLTMFSVSDEVFAVLTGRGGKGGAYLDWKTPTSGAKSLSQAEYLLEKQNLAKVWTIMLGRQDRDRSDDDTAFFVVMSDAAEASGIRVTDTELRKIILQRFQAANYAQVLSAHRISSKEFESTLRRIIMIERYQSLATVPLATPDPSAVEKLWKSRHQEYAFDFIEVPIESVRADALAAAPSDDDLKVWFEALPDAKRDAYKRDTAMAAELAVYPLEGSPSTDALFAKFPPPAAGPDADAAAKEYYDSFSYVRFRAKSLPTDRAPTAADFYRPFDDVKADALRESAIYRAMTAWQTDMTTRSEKGETVNVAAEAESFGLVYHSQPTALTQQEWIALAVPWTGRNLGEFLTGAASAGKFLPAVSVDEKALVVGRALAKEDPRAVPFDEVKDRVREEWLKQRMGELALAKLESVRAQLGTPPDPNDPAAAAFMPEADAQKFALAASDLGLQVQVRDYEERTKRANETAAELFLRNTAALYSTRVNSVVKPELARDGANAYLVRIAGLRDADSSKMTPAEVQSLGRQSAHDAIANFKNSTFLSKDFMKERFAMRFKAWDAKAPVAN